MGTMFPGPEWPVRVNPNPSISLSKKEKAAQKDRLPRRIVANRNLGFFGIAIVFAVQVLMRLMLCFLYLRFGICSRLQVMNSFAQALRRWSDHLCLQLIKGNAQVVGDVDRG